MKHLPFLAPLLFVALWVFTLRVIAALSGWRELAERYPDRTASPGRTYRFQSVGMRRGMNLNNCLNVGVGQGGLHLSMFKPFSAGHDPIFVPWGDIAAVREKGRFFGGVRLVFARSPENWVKVPERLGRRIEADSGGRLAVAGEGRGPSATAAPKEGRLQS